MSSLNTASTEDCAISKELIFVEQIHRFDILQVLMYKIEHDLFVGKVARVQRKNINEHWILVNREGLLGRVPLDRAVKLLLDQPPPYQWGLGSPEQIIGAKPLIRIGKPEWRYGLAFWAFAIFFWGIAAGFIFVLLLNSIGETLPLWANWLAAVAFVVLLQRIPIKRKLLSVQIPDAYEDHVGNAPTANRLPKASPCVEQFTKHA